MATTINLTDPVSALVIKTNASIGEVGQPGSLNTTYNTDLVGAINEVLLKTNQTITKQGQLGSLDTTYNTDLVGAINEIFNASQDSAEIIGIINNYFGTSGGSNVFDVASIAADSADIGVINSITLAATSSVTLTNAKQFTVKNSSGTVLLGGYLLSTSNLASTP